jgi:hypothetical protein
MRFAALLCVVMAAASANALPVIELVAPANATELTGGSTATIEWRAAAPLPRDVEEWEAFLSVDGGEFYALRITPHLDRDIRRFTFTVPNVASHDTRILLRFGDEERETEVELPLRFSIRADRDARARRAEIVEEEGERARPADEPVAGWTTGERDGSQLRVVVHRSASFGAAEWRAIRFSADENADARTRDLTAKEPGP